mgnify:CR=1 FL=1
MKLYNFLTKKMDNFNPEAGKKIGIYVCGPTVYSYIHVGNARPAIFFDAVVRYLRYRGHQVFYVSNITDIDDKIINKAISENVSEREIAHRYSEEYLKNLAGLNCEFPDTVPFATKYIDHIIEFIKSLISKNLAYEKNGNVYFRVNSIKTYGAISHQNTADLEVGARVSLNQDKEDPLDFLLWKKTEEGIKFKSPFSEGRPGWHTECAVMNKELFQDTLLIHGGGSDLKFPHHENERAQFLGETGHELSKYYMHVGRVNVDNQKMSKSLGNVINVNEIIKNSQTNGFRLLILSHNFESPINFSRELLQENQTVFTKLQRKLRILTFNHRVAGFEFKEFDKEVLDNFKKCMEDGFLTPLALSDLQQVIKKLSINETSSTNAAVINSVYKVLEILGFKIKLPEFTDADFELYKTWQQARLDKDFKKADKLRASLTEKELI